MSGRHQFFIDCHNQKSTTFAVSEQMCWYEKTSHPFIANDNRVAPGLDSLSLVADASLWPLQELTSICPQSSWNRTCTILAPQVLPGSSAASDCSSSTGYLIRRRSRPPLPSTHSPSQ